MIARASDWRTGFQQMAAHGMDFFVIKLTDKFCQLPLAQREPFTGLKTYISKAMLKLLGDNVDEDLSAPIFYRFTSSTGAKAVSASHSDMNVRRLTALLAARGSSSIG